MEALQWSGMPGDRLCRCPHRLSLTQLYRWRNLLETGEVEVDWHALLHPSARPPISTNLSASAYRDGAVASLTDEADVEPTMATKGQRRRFSVEEKRAILDEAATSGQPLSAVARAHGIANSMIFRWRAELGLSTEEEPVFAAVKLRGGAAGGSETMLLDGLIVAPKGTRLVQLNDGRRVFAPACAGLKRVRREIAEREAQS